MSLEDRTRIARLRRSGLSQRAIAAMLGVDVQTVRDVILNDANLPSGGSGAGLNLGAWAPLDAWTIDPTPLGGEFPAVAALTVPSELFVFGYFDITGSGSSGATVRLHEGVPSTAMEGVIDWQDSVTDTDTTILLRGTIAANVVPSLRAAAADHPEAVVIQVAKRRPLA